MAHQDHRDHQVKRDIQDIKGQLDHQVKKDSLAQQVYLVKGSQVKMVYQDNQAHQVRKVIQDHQVCQESQDCQDLVNRDSQDQRVIKV